MTRPDRISVAAVALASVALLAGCGQSGAGGAASASGPTSGPELQLSATEPDDRYQPVLDLIGAATSSIDVVIYQFNDDTTQQALIGAHQAGRKVRVLFSWQLFPDLNSTDPESKKYNRNTETFNSLKAAGVEVAWSRPQFPYTHSKSIVIDAGTAKGRAMIADFNFEPGYFGGPNKYDKDQAGTRGFAVTSRDPGVVAEMTRVFAADWPPYAVGEPYTQPGMVWSPTVPQFPGEAAGNAGVVLPELMTKASKSLDVYLIMADEQNRQLDDLTAAANRGVTVRTVANCGTIKPADVRRLAAAGVQIGYRPKSVIDPAKWMFVHTKSIVTDFGEADQVGYVGSQNIFLAQSLADLREVGLTFTDPEPLAELHATFDRDVAASQPTCPAPAESPAPVLE